MITQQQLHEMFEYVETTGVLVHRYTVKGGKRKGEIAGSPHAEGYLQIGIRRKKYLIHRLIWLYHYGEMPGQLDHVNGVRDDNRIENLRSCTFSQNHGNRGIQKNNTSGFKGVTLNKKTGKWRAQLGRKNLGEFRTSEEAKAQYDKASKSYYREFHRSK